MGFFITFEGIEGCGKTTQIRRLTSFLKTAHREFLLTREPGGTEIGDQIRKILLDGKNIGLDPMAELFLYAAARVQHLRQAIFPALREGRLVLCDRFADATLAYQGYGRGLDPSWIDEIHRRAMDDIRPDLTFLLDLPADIGLRRARKRIEGQTIKEDRFERENLEFHRRVREGYLQLARREPHRFVILDGMKDEESLHREIVARLPAEVLDLKNGI